MDEETSKIARIMQTADIAVLCERGLKHAIDRKILQHTKRWHHVLLYLGNGKALEVTPWRGCHISELNLSRKRCLQFKIIRNEKIAVAIKKKLVQNAVKLFLGKKFSDVQAWRILLFRYLRLRKKEAMLNIAHKIESQKVTCSNMPAMSYYTIGVLLNETYKPEYLMPKDYETVAGFRTIMERNYG